MKRALTNEDTKNVYSLRGPIGFAQHVILEKAVIDVFNTAAIKLKGKKILDLGCGTGQWLRFFAEIRGETGSLIGVDCNKAALRQGQALNPLINYIFHEMQTLKYYGTPFDLITAFVSFMFLKKQEDLEKTLDMVARNLKSGGYFLFFDILGEGLKDGKRAYMPHEIEALCGLRGLKLIDRRFIFRTITDARNQPMCTAYLGNDLPLHRLLLIEDDYPEGVGFNNFMCLFRKGK